MSKDEVICYVIDAALQGWQFEHEGSATPNYRGLRIAKDDHAQQMTYRSAIFYRYSDYRSTDVALAHLDELTPQQAIALIESTWEYSLYTTLPPVP